MEKSDKLINVSNAKKKPFFLVSDVSSCSDIPLKSRIRILLLRKGLSQNQLADACGVSKAVMSELVNGKWKPTTRTKIRMAKTLEVDSLVIFGATEYWEEWRDKRGYPEKEEEEEDGKD